MMPHGPSALQIALGFLELPEWKTSTNKLHDNRNEGNYEQTMDPTIRRRLEEYFEPHNRRLYEYLGVDFGW
jgi:hypothetical protein